MSLFQWKCVLWSHPMLALFVRIFCVHLGWILSLSVQCVYSFKAFFSLHGHGRHICKWYHSANVSIYIFCLCLMCAIKKRCGRWCFHLPICNGQWVQFADEALGAVVSVQRRKRWWLAHIGRCNFSMCRHLPFEWNFICKNIQTYNSSPNIWRIAIHVRQHKHYHVASNFHSALHTNCNLFTWKLTSLYAFPVIAIWFFAGFASLWPLAWVCVCGRVFAYAI